MSGQGLDLRAEVHAIMKDTDLASPEEIAEKVAENIPAKQLRLALRIALREFVRVELVMSRMRSNTAPTESNGNGAARSAKVAAIRDAAPGWLRERICVAEQEYKLVGDCTVDDLHWLARDRTARATAAQRAAQRYATLADLCLKHRVERVAQLPASVLAAFDMGDAA